MKLFPLGIAALAFAAASHVQAAAPKRPAVAPPALQIEKAKIDRALADMVSSGRVTGASAFVWKDGREVYFGTAGQADREAARPMRRNALVQIYSMTKPITGVVLMQLWEQGKFGLDDPLARYLPEFGDTKVFASLDSAGKPILRAPDRPISVRDILRHTAGFGYGQGESYPEQEWARIDPLRPDHDLTEFGRRLARVPLFFDPGQQWRYSAGVDVQALLVEKLTGVPFESYVRQRIFEPLEMKDSAWTQPDERFARLAVRYEKAGDGKLRRASESEQRGLNFDPLRKLTMGGAGIASTADDYMRFARMLLNEGSLDGVQILKPSTVKLMATDQLDPRVTERSWLPSKGRGGFGFDFFVRTSQPGDPNETAVSEASIFGTEGPRPSSGSIPSTSWRRSSWCRSCHLDGTLHRDFRRAVYGDKYLGPDGD